MSSEFLLPAESTSKSSRARHDSLCVLVFSTAMLFHIFVGIHFDLGDDLDQTYNIP
jgi:hypothetical protein